MGAQQPFHRRSINIELTLGERRLYERQYQYYVEDDPEESHQIEEEFQNQGRLRNGNVTLITHEQSKKFPYNCVGVLFFNSEGQRGHGSGILIASDLVLTSAHNLRNFAPKKSNKFGRHINSADLVFYPGLSGQAARMAYSGEDFLESSSVRGIRVRSYRLPQEFTTPNSIEFDYALLRLSEPVFRSQYFPLGIGYKYIRETLTNIGYREDDVNYDQEVAHQKMQTGFAEHTVIDRVRLHHRITTTKGNSGSAISVEREDLTLAVAIHKGIITKAKGRRLSMGSQENSARIISEDVLERLLGWEREFFLEDFESKIKAYQLDASPTVTPITVKKGILAFDGMRENASIRDDLKERLKVVEGEWNYYQTQCDSFKEKINQVIKKIEEITIQKQGLQFQLRIQNCNYQTLLEQIRLLKDSIKTLQNEQNRLVVERQTQRSNLKRHQSKENKASKSNHSHHHSLSPFKQSKYFSPKKKHTPKQKKNHIQFWDLKTRFAERFIIHDRKVVLRDSDIARYQITTIQPLPNYSTTTFKLRCYGGQSAICLGLITADRKGYQSSGGIGHLGSVGYWSSLGKDGQGKVEVDGVEGLWNGDLFVPEGSVLVMDTDQYDMTVTFYLQYSERKYQYKLSNNFKGKELFAFVGLACKGDSVEILL